MEISLCKEGDCMKASIITLHYIYHYGSLLQTYATCKMFEKIGIETEIIDYIRPNADLKAELEAALSSKNFGNNALKKNLFLLVKKIENIHRKKFSNDFLNKYVKLTRRYSSYDDLKENPPQADIYCTGSDQTWNSEYNGGFLPAYYLEFAPSGKKRIGFAISIGMDSFPKDEIELIRRSVTKYTAISVREKSAVDLIHSLGYENVMQVLDPTLGLNLEDWKPLIAARKIKKKYILIYKLNPNSDMEDFARKLAKKKNCKIVRVSYYLNHFKEQGKMEYSPSVEGFLSLIYNAESIITDSFHCVAFSLNFNKDFYAFYPGKYSLRISSIMEMTGTRHRIVGENSYSEKSIDFNKVNSVLSVERKKTIQFLIENCK